MRYDMTVYIYIRIDAKQTESDRNVLSNVKLIRNCVAKIERTKREDEKGRLGRKMNRGGMMGGYDKTRMNHLAWKYEGRFRGT